MNKRIQRAGAIGLFSGAAVSGLLLEAINHTNPSSQERVAACAHAIGRPSLLDALNSPDSCGGLRGFNYTASQVSSRPSNDGRTQTFVYRSPSRQDFLANEMPKAKSSDRILDYFEGGGELLLASVGALAGVAIARNSESGGR